MTQYDKVMRAMLRNRKKKIWTAVDFQHFPYFIGYEASARMSELKDKYPDVLKVGKLKRFRTLSINWDNVDEDFIKSFEE